MYRYYAAALPCFLNVCTSQSFLILNAIVGGQAIAAVSDKLSDTLGIVIIGLISFAVRSNYRIIMLCWSKKVYFITYFLFFFLNRLPSADTDLCTGMYILIL